jgi:ABC-type transport system involved in multi-copper enzyme maturation permease subunit
VSTLALKGSYWVTVRQYRRTLWTAGALAALSLAVIGGLRIWSGQIPDRRLQDGTWAPADESRGYEMLRLAMEYAGTGLILLPLLAGAFVAGPLVAREFESGTYRLGLTQSVTPTAWLRAKLLTAGGAALAITVVLMGVYRIGWTRVAGSYQLSWGDRGPYEATGVVLVAYVLAAVAVGTLVGQLIRRTVLAMAATGLVMGLVLFVLGSLRWSFVGVETHTGPISQAGGALEIPGNGLMMDMGLLTRDGRRIEEWTCYDGGSPETCWAAKNVVGQYVDYHPESHFWPTQLIETGILLALAALALLAAFRLLRARLP